MGFSSESLRISYVPEYPWPISLEWPHNLKSHFPPRRRLFPIFHGFKVSDVNILHVNLPPDFLKHFLKHMQLRAHDTHMWHEEIKQREICV